MRISDWSSDVCSSDLYGVSVFRAGAALFILMGLAGCTGLVPSAGQRGAPPPQRASGTAPAARPVPAKPMDALPAARPTNRSEEHTSELQSLMRLSYAVFCLKKKKHSLTIINQHKISKKPC